MITRPIKKKAASSDASGKNLGITSPAPKKMDEIKMAAISPDICGCNNKAYVSFVSKKRILLMPVKEWTAFLHRTGCTHIAAHESNGESKKCATM